MTMPKTIDVQGGVLVGHDGSIHADRALDEAVRLAGAFQLPLIVIRAWSMLTAPRPDTWSAGFVPPLEDFAAATLAALERDVAGQRRSNQGVSIRTLAVRASPAECLIEASNRVDYVVVGRRGLGGFAGLLLGSVSDQVVRYAQCAVLVANRGVTETEAIDQGQRQIMEQALASELKLATD